jgi:hypothetical protein
MRAVRIAFAIELLDREGQPPAFWGTRGKSIRTARTFPAAAREVMTTKLAAFILLAFSQSRGLHSEKQAVEKLPNRVL